MATNKKREKEIEAYLRKVTRQHDGEYRKWVSPGHRGVPDDIIIAPCIEPHVQFVEAKAPGETPEEHQVREHERLRKAGAVVHVLDTKDAVDDFFFFNCTDPNH